MLSQFKINSLTIKMINFIRKWENLRSIKLSIIKEN